MRRLVHDPFVDDADLRAAGAEPATLDEVFRESDVVCLAVPLTPATRHLVGARELALMKPGAWIVNTTRGAVVDESALIEVLRERRIAGAGLDVFEQEPLDPTSPLLGLDNVILAPHALGSTDECFALIGRSVIAQHPGRARRSHAPLRRGSPGPRPPARPRPPRTAGPGLTCRRQPRRRTP